MDLNQPKLYAQTNIEQQRFCTTTEQGQVETTQMQEVIDMVPASWLTQESRSAPELTSINLKEHNEMIGNYSDSYTSTCTTTTTTSEEYQRMYNAQSSLTQSQFYYDQSSIDLNSSNCDYEVVSIQQQQGSFSSGSTDLILCSGRRSAQECTDSICNTINTSQLVNYIKDNFAMDGTDYASSASALPKLSKRVEFSENICKVETDTLINSGSQPSSVTDDQVAQITEIEQQPEISEPLAEHKVNLANTGVNYNATPKEWTSLMVQALTTASAKPFTITDLPESVVDCSAKDDEYAVAENSVIETVEADNRAEDDVENVQSVLSEKTADEQSEAELDKNENPPKKGYLASLLTTAPTDSVEWFKPVYENVPFPEETVPYFPPNIPLLPIEKHEPLRTKSPFVEALTVAPLRPFTPFENDVISQIEGLPRPAIDVKLIDALTTAPSEPITRFNPDLPAETEAERLIRIEKEKQEKCAAEVRELISKTVDSELSKKCTTFAPFKGFRKVCPFGNQASINQSSQCQSRSSSVCADNQDKSQSTIDSVDQSQTTNKACHNTKESNRNTKKSIAFPPPAGTPVKQYVQSGLQSPKTIPKYQRQWFNLASQSPIRTPEPHELKENVPIAFVDAPHEKTDSVSKPIAITISAPSEAPAAEGNVQYESTTVVDVRKSVAESSSFASEFTSNVATVLPTLPDSHAGSRTMTFQTIDPKDVIKPMRSVTPSLINKPPPMIPYYQQNLACEYYPAPNSFTLDPSRRSPSPRPDAVKSPAPGPPPSILKIQAPRITTPDSLELSTSIGVPSISAGQSGAHVLAASRKGYETSSHSFVKQPEVFHREQKDGLSFESHTTGSQLNEAKKSEMQSSSTVQLGNVQVQRSSRVIEEFEHSQKQSTTEIHSSSSNANQYQQQIGSGSSEYQQNELQYGRGFVAKQARRLSETTSQPNRNYVASYRFPQTTSDITDSGFPISPSNSFNPPNDQTVDQVNKLNAPQKTSFPPPPPQTPINSMYKCPSSPVQKTSFPPPIDVVAYDAQFNNNQSSCLTATASLTQQSKSSATATTSAYQNLTSAANPSAFLPSSNYGNTYKPISTSIPGAKPSNFFENRNTVSVSDPTPASAGSSNKSCTNVGATSAPNRGRGVLNASVAPGGRIPKCGCCSEQIR